MLHHIHHVQYVFQLLVLYGNIGTFTQQSLEKNWMTVQQLYFINMYSNCKEQKALLQVLEKRNKIEDLEASGDQGDKSVRKGHNKRTRYYVTVF